MFHIYIDKDTLAEIYVKEKDKDECNQNVWYKIFKKQNYIYVNIAGNLKGDYSDEISLMESQDDCDPHSLRELYKLQQLADFQQGYNIEIKKSLLVDIDNIEANPAIVHNDPCAIYILKIDKQKAEKIQKNYGVICQSIDSLDDSCLTKGVIDMSPRKGEREYGWNKILKQFKKIPSNAVLINDRNLFSNETQDFPSGKPGNKSGLDNLFEILDSIVPKSFCGEYHVFVCFDSYSLKHVSVDYICSQIVSLKKRLNRRNNIVFEMFVLHGTSSYDYEITHNRRILTNYFILTAEHQLKAFDDSKCICSQHITGNKLYNYGLYDYNDAPEKLHRGMICDFKDMVNYYIKEPKNKLYIYYLDEKQQEITSIKNRILSI